MALVNLHQMQQNKNRGAIRKCQSCEPSAFIDKRERLECVGEKTSQFTLQLPEKIAMIKENENHASSDSLTRVRINVSHKKTCSYHLTIRKEKGNRTTHLSIGFVSFSFDLYILFSPFFLYADFDISKITAVWLFCYEVNCDKRKCKRDGEKNR